MKNLRQRKLFPDRGKSVFILAIGLIFMMLIVAAIFYIRNGIASVKKKIGNELVSIAELKRNGITEWYLDEINDAAAISANTFLHAVYLKSISSGDEASGADLITFLNDLKTEHGYSEIFLTDVEGNLRLSTSADSSGPGTALVGFIKEAVREKMVICTGLYLSPVNNAPRIDFIAPLALPEGELQSAIVLSIDPYDYLYPLLSFYPSPGRSSESVLLMKEGDQVLVLSNLRFEDGAALRKRIPLPDLKGNKALATDGFKGIIEITDYRGIEIYAYLCPVEGTSWYLITKIDKDELYSGLREEIVLVLILLVLVGLFLGAVFWLYNAERQRRVLASLLQAREEFRTTIYSIGDGVIITDKAGMIQNMNPVAESLTGWKESDAINRSITEVFRIASEDTDEEVPNPVIKVLSSGIVVGLANHTNLISKDGKRIPIADSGAPIRDESGSVTGAVLVFHDQSQQRNYQAALESSEARYRRMFVENPQPMWIYALESLRFLEVNDAAIEKYGYSHDEFLSMTIMDIRPDDEHERLIKSISETSFELNHAGEWKHLKKNGEVIWVVIVSHLVTYNGIRARHVMVDDITERKLAEQALQRSEEKFRVLFENHSAVKLLIDAASGQIVDANASATAYYGWTYKELTGMNIADINTLPADKLKVEMENVRNRKQNHFEFRHRHKDGSFSDVEVFSSSIVISGKVFLHSIVHDVSAKKFAEQRVNLLIRSIEQSPVGIIITNPHGIIEFVNPKYLQMSGLDSEELIGFVPSLLNRKTGDRQIVEEVWAAVGAGKEWSGEYPEHRRNGGTFWENAVISPVFDKEQQISHYVIILEDITAQKRMISELKAAKEKAEESDRLKSAFLANMSHEIRTPMNGIIGFMDLLQEPDLESELRSEYIGIVKSSGERLLSTINDIIDISKIESGQAVVNHTRTNVNQLIDRLYKFFRFEADEKGLVFSVEQKLNDEQTWVNSDHVKLESILTNLIKNALKFTRRGSVKLSYWLVDDSMLEFRISDTGKGIPADRLQSIFERFVQADVSYSRDYEGSGLGLSICKAYAGMMGGDITVESEVGKGSVFIFTLPYLPADEGHTAHEKMHDSVAEPPAGNLILVAEDDDISYYYLNKLLAGRQVKLIRALNGEEAVMQCRENPNISLVLMDIKMPLLDGYDATRQILEIRNELPVVALTAYAFEEDRQKALDCGCVDYVSKPLKRDTFLAMIDRYMPDKKGL